LWGELIFLSVAFLAMGMAMLFVARCYWRKERTGETIRQTFFFGGMGLGLILGMLAGAGLAWLMEPANPRDAALMIAMGTMVAAMLAGYAFGRIVELWIAKRPTLESDDYFESDEQVGK
jgi:hypothetical protein